MAAPTFAGFQRKLVVGIAEFAAANSPDMILTTYSLGSCIGVAVYDPVYAVGGLVHVMLPESKLSPEKAAARPGMFMDTGVPALLRAVCQMRADKSRLLVYVVGGAQIMDTSGYFNIGKRNYEALQGLLRQFGLRIYAEEVGGLVNRTVNLHIATGEVWLKISGQPKEVQLCRR